MNKKLLFLSSAILLLFSASLASANWFTDLFGKQENLGASIITVKQGGTGATTFGVGECLFGNGTDAVYSGDCAAGSMTALPPTQIYVGNASNQATATSSLSVAASGDVSILKNLDVTGTVTGSNLNVSDWDTAYGWGNHAGLYDILGQATSTLGSHTTTYNHANYDTAYGWGNHAGLYDVLGQATSTLGSHTTTYNHGNYDIAYNSHVKTICKGACDYTTDGTDDQVQIQQAVNDLSAVNGGTLYFKAGVYSISDTITLPKDPYIKFLGEKIIKNESGVNATSGAAIIQVDSPITTLFSMSGNASASSNGDLSHDFQIESMFINGMDQTTNCFLLTNVDFIKIRDFRIKGCTNGIKTVYAGVDPATAATKPGGIFLNSGSFGVTDNVSGVNVDLEDQTQVWISDVWFSGVASSTIIASSSNKIHVSNCEFNTADNSITVGDRANTISSDITLNNNVFAPGSGHKVFNNLMTNSSSDRIIFSGNTYPSGSIDSLTSFQQPFIQPLTTVSNGNFSIIPNGTGAVGIGTTTPNKPLHLWRSNTVTNPFMVLEQSGTGDAGIQFILTNSRAWNVGVDNSDAQNSFKISTTAAGFDGNTEYFKIDQLGNLTFATTTISTSLTVTQNSALGTVTSGTWNGTAIGVAYGGTGSTTLTGILKGNGTNGVQTAVAADFPTLNQNTTGTAAGLSAVLGETSGGTHVSSFTGGSLLYANAANNWTTLASSTANSFLTIDTNGLPAWTTPYQYPGFSIASSTWMNIAGLTSSSTILLKPSYTAETWSSFRCMTDTGTGLIKIGDGTNFMTTITASSTAGDIVVSSNNTFTAGEAIKAVVSNIDAAVNWIACSVKKVNY